MYEENRMSKLGVTVYCWGVEPQSNSSGTLKFIQSELWGGNLGHAAILLRIPNTPENLHFVTDRLGSEYNFEMAPQHVPWVQKEYIIPSIDLNQQNPKPSYENPAYQENVIEIYFSWCNQDTDMGFGFQTFEEDLIDGRCDVTFNYADKWKAFLQPEERSRTSGSLSFFKSNTSILLGSSQVIHTASLTPEEQAYLELYQKQSSIQNQIDSIEILLDKIQNRISQNNITPLTGTERRLLIKHLPDIDIQQPLDFDGLVTHIMVKKSKLISNKDEIYFDILAGAMNLMNQSTSKKHSLTASEQKALLRLNGLLSNLKMLDDLKLLIEKAINAANRNELTSDILSAIEENVTHFPNVRNQLLILKCYRPELLNECNGYLELLKEIPYDFDVLHRRIMRMIDNPNHRIKELLRQYTDQLIERTVTTGLYPAATITLPLRRKMYQCQAGLDYEAMIEKMAELVKHGNEFNIIENNCSVSSTKVLIAGAQDAQHREEIFMQAELANTVTSPETLFRNAVEYEKSLQNPNYRPPITSYYQLLEQYAAQTAANQIGKSYADGISLNKSYLHLGMGVLSLTAYSALALPRYLVNLGDQQIPISDVPYKAEQQGMVNMSKTI